MKTVAEIAGLLRSRGHRMTEQRVAIIDIVLQTKGHIRPPEVLRRVQETESGVNGSTVYRTLTLLEEVGILSHAHLEGGPEYHHVDAHDHVHLECNGCGRDLFVHLDDTTEMRALLEKQAGFRADFTHFAIAGTCGDCLNKDRGA